MKTNYSETETRNFKAQVRVVTENDGIEIFYTGPFTANDRQHAYEHACSMDFGGAVVRSEILEIEEI